VISKVTRKSPQTKKKSVEKFRVVNRVGSSSPLFSASLIEWATRSNIKPEPLLVTVSRVSGSSVLRNRWKRLIKEWFYSQSLKTIPGQSIWIRYNRTKTLKKPLLYQDWARMLSVEANKLIA
jgi:ribonuclease P protein component